MKTLRWSLDEKNRPIKDVNGQFWGRRKAEAEASRRRLVKARQKYSIDPMSKDQEKDWRKGTEYSSLFSDGDIYIYKDTPHYYWEESLPFWNKRSAELFIENAKRKGIPLEDAIKQARIEYGWDEATVKESLTVQQDEPVKWIERKEGERGEIGDQYTFYMTDLQSTDGWFMITESNPDVGQKAPWNQHCSLRVRYLNPEWVEWKRKNDETQVEPNKTTEQEPEPTEKQHLTALLRAEIEKRNIRIDKMRKALNEAVQEVQP